MLRFVALLCAFSLFGFQPALAGDSQAALRVGFHAKSFPDFSTEDIEISIKMLAEELGKNIGVDTHVSIYQDIKAMSRDFEQGTINFVVASSILLVSEFDTRLFGNGFRFARSEQPERFLVLGRIKPGFKTFQDYRNKRLVLAQYNPMADLYIDLLSRTYFHQDYRNGFKELPREKNAHQQILKLFFDQADLTCVYQHSYDTAIEMNPQLKNRVQILTTLENVLIGLAYIHKDAPDFLQKQLIDNAVQLTNYPLGQQLITLFNSNRVIQSTPADLDASKRIYDQYRRLLGKR